jgi:hypothetical protein
MKTPRLSRDTLSAEKSHDGAAPELPPPQLLPDSLGKAPLHPGALGPRAAHSAPRTQASPAPARTALGGWGAHGVATRSGVHLAARQLAVALAYYETPLAAAARAGAHASQQDVLLRPGLLGACKQQLQQARSSMHLSMQCFCQLCSIQRHDRYTLAP